MHKCPQMGEGQINHIVLTGKNFMKLLQIMFLKNI